MKKISNNILLAIASGVLGFLAFPPLELTFLAWVSLVPLLFAIRNRNLVDAFKYAYVAGITFFGGLLYWLVNVSVPGMILLVAVLALFYGIFGLVAGLAFRRSINLLLLPVVWVVLEYIRAHILTGFPWGFIGHSQYENIKLIQIADITGAYGVSFVLVAFNIAFFALLARSKKKKVYIFASLFFIIASLSYGMYRSDDLKVEEGPVVGIVQGNVPQDLKWDSKYAEEIIENYSSLTRQAAEKDPDMIIWPETAYPYLVDGIESNPDEITALVKETGVPVLAGTVYTDGDKFYNSAAFFTEKGSDDNRHSKLHLVPFGEYIPLEKYLSKLRGYVNKPIGNFARGDEYTLFRMRALNSFKGPGGTRIRRTDFYKFGVLICFEDIFPYLAREFVLKGASFLVNITNDAWFGRTAASRQHMQSSVFRAVENKRTVIRAANTGISCFIDPVGRITSGVRVNGVQTFVRGIGTDKISIYNGRTYYTANGDIFVYFCAFIILIFSAVEVGKVKRGKIRKEEK